MNENDLAEDIEDFNFDSYIIIIRIYKLLYK